MGFRSRIYYRNIVFHLGHLKTLYDNNIKAAQEKGVCYAYIDDRENTENYTQCKKQLKYLGLTNITPVSIKCLSDKIMKETLSLVRNKRIYLANYIHTVKDVNKVLRYLSSPFSGKFQIKTCDGMCIGYTSQSGEIIFLYDYIIKTLDRIFKITDVIIGNEDEKSLRKPGIKYHKTNNYNIVGFSYSKTQWKDTDHENPYLLTVRGMQNRGVPPQLLKKFYDAGCFTGRITIEKFMDDIFRHCRSVCKETSVVVDPVEIIIEGYDKKVFINKTDIPVPGDVIGLREGVNIICDDIIYKKHSSPSVHASLVEEKGKKIKFVEDKIPFKVLFHIHNWVYTGYNDIIEPYVLHGYVSEDVFKNLQEPFYVKGMGYFTYHDEYSSKFCMPTFIMICGDQ